MTSSPVIILLGSSPITYHCYYHYYHQCYYHYYHCYSYRSSLGKAADSSLLAWEAGKSKYTTLDDERALQIYNI